MLWVTRNTELSSRFVPFSEPTAGRRSYSKLILRAELDEFAYMDILISTDSGVWKKAGTLVGTGNSMAQMIRLPVMRCDKFEIKIEGKGNAKLLSLVRYVESRSDV